MKIHILGIIATFLIVIINASNAQQGSATSAAVPTPKKSAVFFTGADLSYVNELEDCGAKYFNKGKKSDPFEIFSLYGADIVRVRLWHNPQWTKYSNFDDVAKTIKRAKENKMRVMLNFHYSDTWADPSRQEIPDAWKKVTNLDVLSQKLYDYTYDTLQKLNDMNLTPTFVQVGNETNAEILQPKGQTIADKINWQRNSDLLNSGISAVRDFSNHNNKKVAIILHIAQPENAQGWFTEAAKHGVTDFDIIGLTYYPQWSKIKLDALGQTLIDLSKSQEKPVMIVETGYPSTLENADTLINTMAKEALLPEFPATPNGQLDFLLALSKVVKNAGGIGVIYWEPAWISTRCKTLHGQGSSWDNGAFFDASRSNTALPAFNFFREAKQQ